MEPRVTSTSNAMTILPKSPTDELTTVRIRKSTGRMMIQSAIPKLWVTAAVATMLALGGTPKCIATEDSASPVYLGSDVTAFLNLLPAPPADESPAGQADLTTVLWFQEHRTPEQIAKAQELAPHTPFQMGARALGPDFTPERLPRTAEIFKRIRDQSRPAILATKGAWNRARPYLRDSRVQPCVPKPKSASYPSGHSTEAALWAGILGAVFPDHSPIFEKEIQDTMWSRVVGGVHYPTDTEAGLRLGREIARQMLATEDMQTAIETIRAEVAGK